MRVQVHAALSGVLPQEAQVLAGSHPAQVAKRKLLGRHEYLVDARHLFA